MVFCLYKVVVSDITNSRGTLQQNFDRSICDEFVIVAGQAIGLEEIFALFFIRPMCLSTWSKVSLMSK